MTITNNRIATTLGNKRPAKRLNCTINVLSTLANVITKVNADAGHRINNISQSEESMYPAPQFVEENVKVIEDNIVKVQVKASIFIDY